ncbi:MAG: hypothetical protein ACTSXD_05065 [Candidatus Heimdallarchaeaceae archaeon]
MSAIRDVLGVGEEPDEITRALANELSIVLGREVKIKKGGTILKLSDMNKEDVDEDEKYG